MRRSASAPFFSFWLQLQGRRAEQRGRQVSPEVKILIAAFASFFTFLLCISMMSSSSAMSPWHHRPSPPLYTPSPLRKGYGILLNTWKRNDLLKQSVLHYLSCSGVEDIHIIWSEPQPPPDSLYDFFRQALQSKLKDGQKIEVKFHLNDNNSLNNRFKEIKDLNTDSLLSIDDDIILPCSTVEFAFSVWQSAPSVMVGFVPRMHWLDESNDRIIQYRYGGWWSVWWRGTYSMVLSKAAFFHKKYLSMYSNMMDASIREYIIINRNCEDIAMSFLIANVSQAPPIWVKGKLQEMGWTGISSLVGHNEQRTQCLNDFARIYGHMPLIATHVKAVDSRSSWFW